MADLLVLLLLVCAIGCVRDGAGCLLRVVIGGAFAVIMLATRTVVFGWALANGVVHALVDAGADMVVDLLTALV